MGDCSIHIKGGGLNRFPQKNFSLLKKSRKTYRRFYYLFLEQITPKFKSKLLSPPLPKIHNQVKWLKTQPAMDMMNGTTCQKLRTPSIKLEKKEIPLQPYQDEDPQSSPHISY